MILVIDVENINGFLFIVVNYKEIHELLEDFED